MRFSTIVALLVGGILVLWMTGAVGSSGIGPDARVQVLTTDPVRIVLGFDADATLIESRVRQALVSSSSAQSDPRMAKHVRELAGNGDLMNHVATSAFEQFNSGYAAGIAYGLYDAAIGDNDVLLIAVTVELLGSYSGVGQTLGHEDGHWYVNNGVAERCGRRIVRDASEESLFPGLTRNVIISRLQRTDERVHTDYHRLVAGASGGTYRTSAIAALDNIVGPSCGLID